MPSLKAIRKRIVSVKNTRKITRAMKLVAAAKLRRAQDTIIAARPYSQAIANVVSELSGVAGKESHALFEERELKRAEMIAISADRGLAGAFNTNVIRAVERYAANELSSAQEVTLRIIGKKAVRNEALAPEGTEWEETQRYASLKGIMAAKKKEIKDVTLAELGVTAAPLMKVKSYEAPPARKAGIKVGSVEELVAKLHNEAKVI